MPMSPGSEAIVGGTVLRIPAIQSPNFAAGSSGWIVRADGSVEFNNGTFRGSLEVGPLSGAHFIVNNTTTGDIIDVYDAANHLIFAVTAAGQAISYTSGVAPQPSSSLEGARVVFSDNQATPTTARITYTPPATTASQGVVTILGNAITNDTGALQVFSGSADATKHTTVQAVERNIQGSVVVSDRISTNNLVRASGYSGTTDAAGHLVFNHNCAFFPVRGTLMGTTVGGTFANLTWGLNNLTATQADVNFHVANTGAAFANSGITFDMVFWG